MKKINTLVVDDDLEWREILSRFVRLNPLLNLIGIASSGIEAYGQLAEKEIDLLICDIEMPDMTGLQFVKNIKNPPLTIFVTAHQHYALDCYEVAPIDFLLKPIGFDRFLNSIERVRQRLSDTDASESSPIEPYFFIRESQAYVQIAYKDVLYIKAQDNFVQIVTKDQSYMPMLGIAKIEERLKADIFLRVHRSYLVHRNAIWKVGKNEVTLTNGQEIPIGDQYRNKINKNHIESYSLSNAPIRLP